MFVILCLFHCRAEQRPWFLFLFWSVLALNQREKWKYLQFKDRISSNIFLNILLMYYLIKVQYLSVLPGCTHESKTCFVSWEICLVENDMLIFMKTSIFLEQCFSWEFMTRLRVPVLLSCDRNWILQHFGSGWGALASVWSCSVWILPSAGCPGWGWGRAWAAGVSPSSVRGHTVPFEIAQTMCLAQDFLTVFIFKYHEHMVFVTVQV